MPSENAFFIRPLPTFRFLGEAQSQQAEGMLQGEKRLTAPSSSLGQEYPVHFSSLALWQMRKLRLMESHLCEI